MPVADTAPVRLDVTGFVGVAWRGPVDEPVAVTGWSQFVERFGGVADPDGQPCPGLLALAVRAFFEQGGARAWIDRIAPVRPDPLATALFELPGLDADLVAASEGRWGSRLAIRLQVAASGSFRPPQTGAAAVGPGEIAVPDGFSLPAGSLLRLSGTPDDPSGTQHWVTDVVERPLPGVGLIRVARLEPPAPDGTATATVLTGTMLVTDGDPTCRAVRGDRRPRAAPLSPALPGGRPGRRVGTGAHGGGLDGPVLPGPAPVTATLVHGGLDRFSEIDGDSLFDADGAASDPLDERTDHRGVDRIGRVDEIGLLCVPDLTWDWQPQPPAPPERPKTPPSSAFRPCAPDPVPVSYAGSAAAVAHLDPQDPVQLAEIVRRQQRLVAVADLRHRFVALLDAPSRLALADLGTWRSHFDSSFTAGYHPWLGAADSGGGLSRPVPPSAFAAGIIASRELRLGLPWGPANEPAVSAVTAVDVVTDAVHDQLHRLGVNVFRAERDGFRLTAARTLSADPGYRQLSVRRLMTMISLAVERQAQRLVFEPNTPDLRSTLRHVLTQFLADLFRGGAFAGATEQESFFVRCDDTLNSPLTQGLGRLVAEIGVAPASPVEYLILRLTQDADGGVQGGERAMTETGELVQTFRFTVTLTAAKSPVAPAVTVLGTGAFSECSGLELEADVQEYLEGGRNDTVVRRVGRVKLVPLVLKRGMFLPLRPRTQVRHP